MAAYDLVTLGESMVQLTPVPLGPLAAASTATVSVAGAESTVASYAARLGWRTAWVSAVGDDPLGERVLHEVAEAGVDVSHVVRDPVSRTGVYFKDPQPGGTRVWYYRAGSAASHLGPALADSLPGARVLHLSGITAALSSSCHELVRRLLEDRPCTGTVSFDVNVRPALWRGRDAAAPLLRLSRAADVCFVGLDEAAALWGATTPDDVRDLLPQPQRLVVKDAAVGATAYVRGEPPVHVPALPVEVVEPVGAGDAFAAGYLHGLLLGLPEQETLVIGHRLAAASLGVVGDVGAVPDYLPRPGTTEGQRT
ncbi:2-dehydro-3-deoxygluconokinase [Motilibacter peucedani]|uniref:2-dehydro-3-deoxygluconokinase n=1 Tax=Motilibacter peucedani TaxID=598650 RepID=A0A420XQ67_9ACTN|nr:sugar kinase [Motilibacter peucedani]RKS75433.1 2-dehydro-3-deoxygluconokinase [Motilibacter peucedani]